VVVLCNCFSRGLLFSTDRRALPVQHEAGAVFKAKLSHLRKESKRLVSGRASYEGSHDSDGDNRSDHGSDEGDGCY
jgi:hypothetical protein